MPTLAAPTFSEEAFLKQVEGWVSAGHDPRVYRTPSGWTLLHIAAEYRDVPAIRYLIRFGVDVNARDDAGWTALHLAVDSDLDCAVQSDSAADLSTARALVELGADLLAKDNSGNTPREIAAAYGSAALKLYDEIVV